MKNNKSVAALAVLTLFILLSANWIYAIDLPPPPSAPEIEGDNSNSPQQNQSNQTFNQTPQADLSSQNEESDSNQLVFTLLIVFAILIIIVAAYFIYQKLKNRP